MKRMSEVFELPVQAVDIECLTMQSSDDTDEAIAQAINNIDALADALGDIVFDYFATINLSNVDIATLNPELHKKMTAATDALAAYRGDK